VLRLDTIPGTVPNPARFPTGCKFHTRCHRTRALAERASAEQTVEITSAGERFRVLKRCNVEEPDLREVQPQHWAACHQIEGYDASPVTEPTLTHHRAIVPRVTDSVAIVSGNGQPLAATGTPHVQKQQEVVS
jgi:hypothetical protein